MASENEGEQLSKRGAPEREKIGIPIINKEGLEVLVNSGVVRNQPLGVLCGVKLVRPELKDKVGGLLNKGFPKEIDFGSAYTWYTDPFARPVKGDVVVNTETGEKFRVEKTYLGVRIPSGKARNAKFVAVRTGITDEPEGAMWHLGTEGNFRTEYRPRSEPAGNIRQAFAGCRYPPSALAILYNGPFVEENLEPAALAILETQDGRLVLPKIEVASGKVVVEDPSRFADFLITNGLIRNGNINLSIQGLVFILMHSAVADTLESNTYKTLKITSFDGVDFNREIAKRMTAAIEANLRAAGLGISDSGFLFNLVSKDVLLAQMMEFAKDSERQWFEPNPYPKGMPMINSEKPEDKPVEKAEWEEKYGKWENVRPRQIPVWEQAKAELAYLQHLEQYPDARRHMERLYNEGKGMIDTYWNKLTEKATKLSPQRQTLRFHWTV